VQENPNKIEAIRILLSRPKDWSTQALGELRTKLAATPERFTEEHLRKAHAIQYRKALVDIISMVTHAADEQRPLLTAEERVKLAFAHVTAGKTFTPEQRQWLGLIEAHLIENLTIDLGDFDLLPVFARKGGLGQATRVFGGQLQDLILQFNEAIAA
jgi:type I restriction enzyme R subunit